MGQEQKKVGVMGYMRHHAIVVTSWDEDRLRVCYEKAVEIGCAVSHIVSSPINMYRSFFVAPDGSKEGWEESDEGDRRRNEFIDWIEAQRDGDGGSYLDYAEVRYGDDDGEASLTRAVDSLLITGDPE